ncbi:MAG: NUDIX hydrolase [Lachnospiraceae bacterium]|nr:NUDIX hydrolase [Lachnospiraceae bacterium]
MEHMKRVDRVLKHRGAIVDFYDDVMESPSGHIAHWDYIAHRKGAAAVVPVLDDGRILMVRQHRNALERETLEIPAGSRDDVNEPRIECAARELEEETGYRAGKLELLITVATTVAFCNELIEIYLATNLTRTETHLDEDEFVEVGCYTPEELKEMIFSQKIQDSKTVAAILAYDAKRRADIPEK